jgi:hypothetical protein
MLEAGMNLVSFRVAEGDAGIAAAGTKVYVNPDRVAFVMPGITYSKSHRDVKTSKKVTKLCINHESIAKSWLLVEGGIEEVVAKLRKGK